MQFYILELQRKFEDVKEILNMKLGAVLIFVLAGFKKYCSNALLSHHFAVISCFFVVAISVFIRSQRDIGHDSAHYLELASGILGSDYSFTVYLSTIPHVLSRLLTISPIISLEICVNVMGIISLYFSSKILRRSFVGSDLTLFNVIMVSFAIGFFLRVFTLSYNEFGTSTTYFLMIAFPYICYQFLEKSQLKKWDKSMIDALAILFIFLQPYYALLAIVFELRKGRFLAASVYLFLLFFIAPDPLIDEYKIYLLSIIFRQDLLPFLAVTVLSYSLIKKSKPLQIFLLATAAIGAIIISEMLMEYDQRFIFYVTFLSFLAVLMLEIIRQGYVNWKRDGVLLFFMAVVLQFSHDVFIDLIFNLSSFWWIFSVVLALSWRKNASTIKTTNINLADKLILQRDIISNILFILITSLTFYLAIERSFGEIILSISVFIILLKSNQNLSEKLTGIKEFSRLSACVILIVMSYVISLHRVAIFVDHDQKSPNLVNDFMIDEIQINSEKGEEFLVISDNVSDSYPLINYANDHVGITSLNNSFQAVLEQLKKKNNKIIFVGIDENIIHSCSVGFLERHMNNEAFKEYFLENYVFLNRIIGTKAERRKLKFEKALQNEKVNFRAIDMIDIIDRDIDVYIRREG